VAHHGLRDRALERVRHQLRIRRGEGRTDDRLLRHRRYQPGKAPASRTGNPRPRDGWLSLEDIGALPHANSYFGHNVLNPADRVLDELGVRRRVQVQVSGWLPLPFVVAGTNLVAIVPERLARRVADPAGVLVVEPPFGTVELIEAAWWHPTRSADPALSWLRGVLRQTGRRSGQRPRAAADPAASPYRAPVPRWSGRDSHCLYLT